MREIKDQIERLYELQLKNLQYSPWIKKTSLPDRIEELDKEVEEVLLEAKLESAQGLKEELGDVLWDCLGIIVKAQDLGYCTVQEILDAAYDKFTQRKPFLLENCPVTELEEKKLWQEAKQKEKGIKHEY